MSEKKSGDKSVGDEINDISGKNGKNVGVDTAENLFHHKRLAGAMAEAMDGCVAIYDASGVIIGTNTAWRRFKAENGNIEFPPPEIAAAVRSVLAGRNDNLYFEHTFPPLSADNLFGGDRGFSIKSSLLDYEGGQAVMVVCRENTRGKRGEEQIKAFLSNIPLSAYVKDINGRYLVVNEYYVNFSGYDYDSIIGKTDFELYQEEVAEEFTKNDRKVLEGKEALTREEIFKINGEVQNNLSIKFPLFNLEGAVYAVAGISMDVTERKLFIRRLRQAKEEAERATRVKSEFLANITHELRTPLNPIINLADILLDTELDDEQRDFIGDIKEAAEKLFTMVTDLIEISRIEAEGLTISSGPFNLRELLNSFIRKINTQVTGKRITTKIDIMENVPDIVVGDVDLLQEIVSKLGDNAAKFTQEGDIALTVKVDKTEEQKIWVSFSLQDTGIGIPKEQLACLFQDFTQADGSSKRKYAGIGLGLTKVRKLIAALGGSLRAESKEDAGSVFSFTLPFELYE